MSVPRTCPVCGQPRSQFDALPNGDVVCGGCGERFDPLAVESGTPADAASRTVVPGVLLIAAATLSLLLSLAYGGISAAAALNGALPRPDPAAPPAAARAHTVGVYVGLIGFPLVSGLVSLLGLVGGVQTYRRRTWGLAVTGAIAASVPCSCGFPLGLVAGVWCLIVLFDPAVKATFR